MGAYINPPHQTKLEWLQENGESIGIEEAKRISKNLSNEANTKMAVCLVDNGPFTAAGICFEENEFEAFNRDDDHRPKTWYKANIEDLKKVSEELERYMEHTNEY